MQQQKAYCHTKDVCVYVSRYRFEPVKDVYIFVSAVSGENLNGKCQSWLHLTDRQKKINHDYIQRKKKTQTNNASKVMIILVINCILEIGKNVKKFIVKPMICDHGSIKSLERIT